MFKLLPKIKQSNKYAQRGGGCSSYFRAEEPASAPASAVVALTNENVFDAYTIMEPGCNRLNALINEFCGDVNTSIVDNAQKASDFYKTVANIPVSNDMPTGPSLYILEIVKHISERVQMIGTCLVWLVDIKTSILKIYASATVAFVVIRKTKNYADNAYHQTILLFNVWRKEFFNLCRAMTLCIFHISYLVQFLNQVANIYRNTCNLEIPPVIPVALTRIVPITDKWTFEHMTDNANNDHNNVLASARGSDMALAIINYKNALDNASTPGTDIVDIARNLYNRGIQFITNINTAIQDNRVKAVYINPDTLSPLPDEVHSYTDIVLGENNIIPRILQNININILYIKAYSLLDGTDKDTAIRNYNNARNPFNKEPLSDADRASIVSGNDSYINLIRESNTKFNTLNPNLEEKIQLSNTTEYVAELKLANNTLDANIKRFANIAMTGGARRHKKLLSLKKNKMHKRTKQNHKSRKTHNTHNTHNTQQRKKHNKQKSHKNKHM